MFFHSIKLEAFCHASEEPEKVREAMLTLIPFEDAEFEEESLEGSFGNEIRVIRVGYKRQQEIKRIIEKLKSGLGDSGIFDIGEHVSEDGHFRLRFDKQRAFEGKIALGGGDTIELRGKVAAFPANRENAIKVMEKAWKGLF